MDMTGAGWRKSSYSSGNGGQCVEVATWRKSSYSSGNGGQCVEVADWHKSSHSTANGGDCVEVARDRLGAVVAVRDSKDPAGPMLTCASGQWRAFTGQVKAGAFDLA